MDIGQTSPRPFFKKIGIEKSNATVDIVLKQSSNFRWAFREEKKNLTLSLIRVTDRALFEMYMSPQFRQKLLEELSSPSYRASRENQSPQSTEIRPIQISDLKTNVNSSYFNKKTKTQDFLFTEKFEIIEDPGFLAFIAITCYGMHPHLSEICGEIVIENAKIVDMAKVNVSNSQGLLLPGAQRGEATQNEVINTTIQDFRDADLVKNLEINSNVVQQSVFHQAGHRSHTGIDKKPKNAYFSDINLALDVRGNCRFHFSMNWAEAIFHNSQFPRFIASEVAPGTPVLDHERRNFQKVLSLSRIRSITIKRRRIHHLSKDNNSSLMSTLVDNAKMKSFYNTEEKVIVYSQDIGNTIAPNDLAEMQSSKTEEKTLKSIGSIREFDDLFLQSTKTSGGKLIPPLQYRHFTGVDLSMAKNNDGEYQYSVEVEIEDGTIKFLNEIIGRLKNEIKDAENYYNYIVMSIKSNNKFKAVSNNFVNIQDLNLSGIALNSSRPHSKTGANPWQRLPALLTEIVNIFKTSSSATPSPKVHQNLYLMSSPHNGSLKGISLLIQAAQSTLSKLESILKTNAQGPQNKGSDSRPEASSGNRQPASTFIIKHDFQDSIDIYEYKNVGYEYISQNRLRDSKGIQSINLNNYQNRTREETLKYFSDISDNIIMPGTQYEDSTSMTEMSYLTPRTIRFPRDVYEMYTLKNNMIKANTDNTIKPLLDIVNYKKLKHIPEVGIALEENSKSITSKANVVGDGDLKGISTANMQNKQIANKLSDLLSFSNCTVELYDPSSECSSDLIDGEGELEKRDLFGAKVANQSDFEVEDPLENTKSTTRGEMALQAHINTIATPIAYMKYLNILGENSRLKAYDTNSSTFNYSTIGTRGTLPNQLKSLIADSAGDPNVNFNWFSEENTLEKIAFFILHYKTLATVEALTGFKNGNLRQPIWQTLNRTTLGNVTASNKSLLCRIMPYSNQTRSVSDAGPVNLEIVKLPIYNQYFLLNIGVNPRQNITAVRPATIKLEEISETLENDSSLRIDNEYMYTSPVPSRLSVNLPPGAANKRTRKRASRGGTTTTATAAGSRGTTTGGGMSSPSGGY